MDAKEYIIANEKIDKFAFKILNKTITKQEMEEAYELVRKVELYERESKVKINKYAKRKL